MSAHPQARFITLEGIDGAGKSTHVETLRRAAQQRGVEVLLTREPGGTVLGERLRELLLGAAMSHDTEVLLMFAARREHLEQVIWPALAGGRWVVCDRFTDATFAYQGGGRGVGVDRIEALAQWVHPGFAPDLTLLFDVPVAVARERVLSGRVPDRFEAQEAAFFERVRSVYLARALREPGRFRVLDGTAPLEAVAREIEAWVDTL